MVWKKKNSEVQKTIAAWKSKLPDYQFIEWNEENFDISAMNYTKEAYELGKMAFVSDVARMLALYDFGGVYLDTDVEIRKDFTEIVQNNEITLGFENEGKDIMTGFLSGVPSHKIWKEMLMYYQKNHFILDGKINATPNTKILTSLLERKGLVCNNEFQILKDDIFVYPEIFFSAYHMKYILDISTQETYTVHHFKASWVPKKKKVNHWIKKKLITSLGYENFKRLYRKVKK